MSVGIGLGIAPDVGGEVGIREVVVGVGDGGFGVDMGGDVGTKVGTLVGKNEGVGIFVGEICADA